MARIHVHLEPIATYNVLEMSMIDERFSRRSFLGASAALLALPATAAAGVGAAARELRFRLIETAGLRRFGYPVSTILPQVRMGNHFRLLRGDRVIPAQFRVVDGPDGGQAVALDFNASPGPLDTETYTVAFGDDLEPGPEPRAGMRVEHKDGLFHVSNGSSLQFAVPDNLLGSLKSVRNARLEFVGEGTSGFMIMRKGGTNAPVGEAVRASVAREGPIAIALRFERAVPLSAEHTVNSLAMLTFPNSKSWVETNWTVDDPEGWVPEMAVELDLVIEGSPTLVDFGAGSMVYGQIKDDESMELNAGEVSAGPGAAPAWTVRQGKPDSLSTFAVAPKEGLGSAPAEGWAHVIDRSRCTAIAVAGFGRGRGTRDQIKVDAKGRVQLRRSFDRAGEPVKGLKMLKFWFHFVTTPVQVGAATSPQAMLAPLKVEWEPPDP
jgi:hypothetical protein